MIYKILTYHFEEDDEKLADGFEKCVKGELMCGEHKKECIEKFIENHRKKKEKLIDKAREILKIG